MNIGVVGAACGLVALGLGSFRTASSAACPPEELAAMQRAQALAAASEAQAAAEFAGKAMTRYYGAQGTYSLALQLTPAETGPFVEFNEEHLENILRTIASVAGKPVQINWTALSAGGVERNTQISTKMPVKDPFAAVEFLNEAIGSNPESGPGPIAIRQRPDGLEIVSTAWLDKREAKLVIYDISAPEANGASAEELVQAITQFIEPSNWKENGGDRAEMNVVGNRLLVKAPVRIHEGVNWMLKQFDGSDPDIESTLSQPAWSLLRSNLEGLAPMPAGIPGPVLIERGHPPEPEQPVEPTEPGEPAGVAPTLTTPAPASASSPSKPVVLTLPVQHSQAELVAQLLQVVTNRANHPLSVEITADAGTNSLIFSGVEADTVKCQQIAAVIDSALGGSPVITKSSVPVLRSLPLLNNFFSGKTASLSVSNQVEIATPKTANAGDR